jgi:hypothetical protein
VSEFKISEEKFRKSSGQVSSVRWAKQVQEEKKI